MNNFTKLIDNAGNRVGVGVTAVTPIPRSGITLNPADSSDLSIRVTKNKRYAVTVVGTSPFIFSISGSVDVDKSSMIEWICTPNETIIISIPKGIFTLYYSVLSADQNTNMAFLRKIY